MSNFIKKLAYWDGEIKETVFKKKADKVNNQKIKEVQKSLNILYPDATIKEDGIMGPATIKKLNQFVGDKEFRMQDYNNNYYDPKFLNDVLQTAKDHLKSRDDRLNAAMKRKYEEISQKQNETSNAEQQPVAASKPEETAALPSGSYDPSTVTTREDVNVNGKNVNKMWHLYNQDRAFVKGKAIDNKMPIKDAANLLWNFYKKWKSVYDKNLWNRSDSKFKSVWLDEIRSSPTSFIVMLGKQVPSYAKEYAEIVSAYRKKQIEKNFNK